MLGAPSRCEVLLERCPSGGQRFINLTLSVTRAFNLFTHASQGDIIHGALPACVVVYLTANVLTYFAVMHVMWLSEHASRLAFLSTTEEVDVEWSLEKLGRPPLPAVFVALEMMVLLALLVQGSGLIQMWL
jgi:hypothetical protein